MVTPFMEALLPALPKLDEMLAPILADETNETGALIKMAFGMLGIEKLADIQTIWNTNTADFELSINLVSGASQPAPAGAKSRVKALRTQKAADRAAFERAARQQVRCAEIARPSQKDTTRALRNLRSASSGCSEPCKQRFFAAIQPERLAVRRKIAIFEWQNPTDYGIFSGRRRLSSSR